jgi:phosphoribosyl-ATP pyrophosphohydrolase
MTGFTLSDLDRIIEARATSGDPGSYTRKLIDKGVPKIAQKVGEEGVETAIAAVMGDNDGLTGEAADLLYHLLVLLRAREVPLSAVMGELERRTAQSGLQEKASRTDR